MNKLSFDKNLASKFKNTSQRIRVLSEDWLSREGFCPSCGSPYIQRMANNKPVLDFICPFCSENFELKSKKGKIGDKVLDGAYKTMLERLQSDNNPNLFLLGYHPRLYEVESFFVVPKHFFIEEIIEKRKPLAEGARRAGWVGCNILLSFIPSAGRIFIVRNKQIVPRQEVVSAWKRTLFLREEPAKLKGWILSVMRCIDMIKNPSFGLDEMYAFEKPLQIEYPNNRHIKDKIRQQLQSLRDIGYLEFMGRGKYRKITTEERHAAK